LVRQFEVRRKGSHGGGRGDIKVTNQGVVANKRLKKNRKDKPVVENK